MKVGVRATLRRVGAIGVDRGGCACRVRARPGRLSGGSIEVCLAATNDMGGKTMQFSLNGGAPITVKGGRCSGAIDVTPGPITVTEVDPDTAVTAVDVKPSYRAISADLPHETRRRRRPRRLDGVDAHDRHLHERRLARHPSGPRADDDRDDRDLRRRRQRHDRQGLPVLAERRLAVHRQRRRVQRADDDALRDEHRHAGVLRRSARRARSPSRPGPRQTEPRRRPPAGDRQRARRIDGARTGRRSRTRTCRPCSSTPPGADHRRPQGLQGQRDPLLPGAPVLLRVQRRARVQHRGGLARLARSAACPCPTRSGRGCSCRSCRCRT